MPRPQWSGKPSVTWPRPPTTGSFLSSPHRHQLVRQLVATARSRRRPARATRDLRWPLLVSSARPGPSSLPSVPARPRRSPACKSKRPQPKASVARSRPTSACAIPRDAARHQRPGCVALLRPGSGAAARPGGGAAIAGRGASAAVLIRGWICEQKKPPGDPRRLQNHDFR
jgi:hypothetical protein